MGSIRMIFPSLKDIVILKPKRKEVITMPRTKGSKNRPKTNTTKDYASQIAEKKEQVVNLTTEIVSIQKAIEEQKNTLKEKKLRRPKPRVWLRDY